MKKLIALIAVCGFAFAFVACGAKKTEEATATDSTTVVEPTPAPVDSAANDSTADSTATQK
jgi:hypothetical protein